MYHQLGETVAKKKGKNLKDMTRLDTDAQNKIAGLLVYLILYKS